jgi:hypothetical protein
MLRASKDGYAPAMQNLRLDFANGSAQVGFLLVSLTPSVSIVGNYTLTFAADSDRCPDLPDEVRTRSYEATIFANDPGTNTSLQGSVKGTTSNISSPGFFHVGVSGDYVTISADFDGPTIIERLGPGKYVSFDGEGGASVGAPTLSNLSVPFNGAVEYCEQNPDSSSIQACWQRPPNVNVVDIRCVSQNLRLTLTRR